MSFWDLPSTTIVNRNIPKNAFDKYANAKQKKAIAALISKIAWRNKVARDTVNLEGTEISEIELFEIKLKRKERIEAILNIIDKAIPYHIVFYVTDDEFVYLSTSKKHPHPTNENNAVIDWTFKTDWIPVDDIGHQLVLKKSIDFIYKDLCLQLIADKTKANLQLDQIIERQRKIEELNKDIDRLKISISKSKQFNKIVELNIELRKKEAELIKFML